MIYYLGARVKPSTKRSLKIEQQIGNESTKRTEKLNKCLVNSKEKNKLLQKSKRASKEKDTRLKR